MSARGLEQVGRLLCEGPDSQSSPLWGPHMVLGAKTRICHCGWRTSVSDI